MFLRGRRSCEAALKSFSAFLTHSRVTGFIKHLAFLPKFPHERVTPTYALRHLGRRPDQEVECKISRDGLPDADGHLFPAVARARHNHQQVHVGVLGGIPVVIGAEEHNFLRAELPSNLPAISAYF